MASMNDLRPGRHHVSHQSPAKHAKRIQRLTRKNSQETCGTLVTVPQTSDKYTCWFNAVLMVLMYSDKMRGVFKKALRESHGKVDPDVLQRFVSLTLMYKQPLHTRARVYEKAYAHGIKPEDILKAVYARYPNVFRGFNAVHNTILGKTGGQGFVALGNMMELFGVNASSLVAYGGFLYETDQFPISQNPDVLCVFVNSYGHHTFKNLLGSWQFPPPLTLSVKSHEYTLDASLLSSTNGSYTHAIAGVTCNSKRFYYNGWSRSKGTCPLIGTDFAHSGIYIGTQQNDACSAGTKQHATDFYFNGTLPQQNQILVYVRTSSVRTSNGGHHPGSHPGSHVKSLQTHTRSLKHPALGSRAKRRL